MNYDATQNATTKKNESERKDGKLMSFNAGIYSFSINWNLGDNLSSH